MRTIHIGTCIVAALACAVVPAASASARPAEAQQEIHQVTVKGGPDSGDRFHRVEEWSTRTAYHRVVRDQRRGGAVILEELADARAGRSVSVDFRRGVRRDNTCGAAERMVEIHRDVIPAVYPGKLERGTMTVAARRTQFGRPVLDLSGDLGEPDAGPKRFDVTIDEGTGRPLDAIVGGERRAQTTAFEVRRRSAAELAADFRLSRAAQRIEAKPTSCR